ncbi:cold-shock protein, partial [Vibrio cholerae]
MIKGKVVEWNDSKGYGFISALNGELRVFLHVSTVQSKSRRPKVDDEVEFEVNEDQKGRYNATNVTILGASTIPSTIIFSFVYLVLASAAVFILGGEKIFIAVYILMS